MNTPPELKKDLERIAYPSRSWVPEHPLIRGQHVYDVIIIGGGQCELATAFGLRREQVTNVLVLDENDAEIDGPWKMSLERKDIHKGYTTDNVVLICKAFNTCDHIMYGDLDDPEHGSCGLTREKLGTLVESYVSNKDWIELLNAKIKLLR
jgi:hypothetical protein